MTDHSIHSLKLAILKSLATTIQAQHKMNLIGSTYQSGGLEYVLETRFSMDDRARADRAFEELKADGMIRSTYGSGGDWNWVEITDEGRQALQRGALDTLDVALQKISSHLVEIRWGAWAAVSSGRPDAIRQAAHSGRELIDQVLKEGAPDDTVKQQPDFKPDHSARSGVTRRHRLQLLMKTYRGTCSGSELRVAEKACDVVLAADDHLQAGAHARHTPSAQDVKNSLQSAEIALRILLVDATAI